MYWHHKTVVIPHCNSAIVLLQMCGWVGGCVCIKRLPNTSVRSGNMCSFYLNTAESRVRKTTAGDTSWGLGDVGSVIPFLNDISSCLGEWRHVQNANQDQVQGRTTSGWNKVLMKKNTERHSYCSCWQNGCGSKNIFVACQKHTHKKKSVHKYMSTKKKQSSVCSRARQRHGKIIKEKKRGYTTVVVVSFHELSIFVLITIY